MARLIKRQLEEKHEVVKIEKKYTIPVTGVSATKISSLPGQCYAIDETLNKLIRL